MPESPSKRLFEFELEQAWSSERLSRKDKRVIYYACWPPGNHEIEAAAEGSGTFMYYQEIDSKPCLRIKANLVAGSTDDSDIARGPWGHRGGRAWPPFPLVQSIVWA